jgi:hypothetical protein
LSDGADYNIVYGNNITDSETGVDFRWAGDHNSFHHNNFVDNTNQVFHFEGETSVWDDGYPSGGNYWSDYTGSDSDGDGIGDVPYVIDADNEDRYPLTSSFTRLYAVIESCDVNGETKDMFNTDENVYVRGSGFVPSVLYPRNPPIYVVEDTTWYNGMEIPERIPETVTTVFSGAFGDIETTLVWNSPLTPGKYDIVVDENSNGVFDQNIDALDDMDVEITAGFYVSRGTLIGFIFDIIIPLIAIVEFVIIVILVLILLKKHGLPPKPPNPKSKE